MTYDFRYANYPTFYVNRVGLLVLGGLPVPEPLPARDNKHTQTQTYVYSVPSGIRTHDFSVQVTESSTRRTLRDHGVEVV